MVWTLEDRSWCSNPMIRNLLSVVPECPTIEKYSLLDLQLQYAIAIRPERGKLLPYPVKLCSFQWTRQAEGVRKGTPTNHSVGPREWDPP